MKTITILAMIAIFAGIGILSTSGFAAFTSAVAQMTMDNATMAGNMTGGNITGANSTDVAGSVSNRKN